MTDSIKLMREEIQKSIGSLPIGSRLHVAVMSEPFLEYVLRGKKTVESRFSHHRVAPYKKVQPGDIVFMKAGALIGYFTVNWVRYFDLSQTDIQEIRSNYGEAICGDQFFWREKSTKRYVTLVGIKDIHKIVPIHITKRDRRGWVDLNT